MLNPRGYLKMRRRYNGFGIDLVCNNLNKKWVDKNGETKWYCEKYKEKFSVIQGVALPNCSALKCNEKPVGESTSAGFNPCEDCNSEDCDTCIVTSRLNSITEKDKLIEGFARYIETAYYDEETEKDLLDRAEKNK
jgi:hypothetical protein